ncbi:MAG: cyclophilin-like fold protein [Candidatus Thermoplasmatota archaeon]|nr:cyclophilin-like fold protein [Candidatus Thermoplasmatota archaeon]
MRIRISSGNISAFANLNGSETAKKILAALPIEGRANRWGDEIYFEIPVSIEEAKDARTNVEIGELGYWPPGSALCIFFGKTPVSTGKEPKAYSPVNVFGKIKGDDTIFKKVKDGEKIIVEKIDGE